MTLDELIKQLEQLKKDYPETAQMEVRANDQSIFAVNLEREEHKEYFAYFIDLTTYRPWAPGAKL